MSYLAIFALLVFCEEFTFCTKKVSIANIRERLRSVLWNLNYTCSPFVTSISPPVAVGRAATLKVDPVIIYQSY